MRLTLLVSLLFTPPLFGQLHWDALQQDQKAKPGDKEAIAKFHFVNSGQSPIRVARVVAPPVGTEAVMVARVEVLPAASNASTPSW